MTNLERQKTVYEMLSKIYFEGGYSGIVFNKLLPDIEKSDRAFVTKLFYGVMEKDVYLSYAIGFLSKNSPKPKISLILKIALYQLYFTAQQPHAVISSAVELTKAIGKKEVSGFVNALLKNYKKVVFPDKNDGALYLSVHGCVPLWIAKKLIKQYGFDFALSMLTAKLPYETHIRNNPNKISKEQLAVLVRNSMDSGYGYYVDSEVLGSLDESSYTAQSVASIKAVQYYIDGLKGGKVLDLCAAPGGKSVLISQSGDFECTACDIHPHRAELIKKYAARMGENINVRVNDATVLKNEWMDNFELVVCDVPCSGIGVIHSKPDILLARKESDLPEIVAVQSKIIETAANYVKRGGRLCYSTCTVLYEENRRVIERFLKVHSDDFELDESLPGGGVLEIYPHIDGCEGFFVAALRRK